MTDIRYNNSFSLIAGFNITSGEPIDSRMYVADIEHIYLDENWVKVKPYPGLIVSSPDGEVRICVNSDYKLESSWKKIGGAGNVSVLTYEEAISLAIEKNIGQVIYVQNDNIAYIVTGANTLMKLAMSTAGDIDSIVAALQEDLLKLQEVVGDEEKGLYKDVEDAKTAIDNLQKINHDAYIDADNELKEELNSKIDLKVDNSVYADKIANIETTISEKAEITTVNELSNVISTKVDKVEGARLFTELEGNKLSNIEDGAQVNKIEKIKVNGEEISITDSDKSVDIAIPSAPVQGIADNEDVLSIDENSGKLSSTIKLEYVASTETNNAMLRILGKNNKVVSTIDASAFVKDGMLSDVNLEGPQPNETGEIYLSLIFNTDSGKSNIRLDVTDLLHYYYGGDGIILDVDTFKIKIDETSNKYLQVNTNGISVSQDFINKINELDNAVLSSAKEYANSLSSNYDETGAANKALEDAKKYTDNINESLDTRIKTLEDIKHEDYALATNVYDKETANSTFVKVDNFNEFSQNLENKLINIEDGAQVNKIENIAINGVDATITDKKAELNIQADDIELGTAVLSNGEEIYSSTEKISAVLQGIQDSITVAVSGGLIGVNSGNGIEVSSVNSNKQTISAKLSVDDYNLIRFGEDGGIFAAMYYDGDDAE